MAGLSVSVVIPTHNRAHLIARAVNSALANIARDDEIIVVDDDSTDSTAAVLAGFGDPVRYVKVPHGGAGAARNTGIRLAQKDLVAFLDSDDEWLPGKLDLNRGVLGARPDVLFCFSNFTVRDRYGNIRPHFLVQWTQDPRSWEVIVGPATPYSSLAPLPEGASDFSVHVAWLYPLMLRACYCSTITVAVRREQAGPALHFAEDLPLYEDWECFARLAQAGKAAFLDCDLAINHGHNGPRLTGADDFTNATTRLRLVKRIWGSDEQFMADHGQLVCDVVNEQHLIRARWLLRHGQSRQARKELRLAGGGPLSHRMLAALPGPVTWGVLGLRQALRGERPSASEAECWRHEG